MIVSHALRMKGRELLRAQQRRERGRARRISRDRCGREFHSQPLSSVPAAGSGASAKIQSSMEGFGTSRIETGRGLPYTVRKQEATLGV